MLASRLAADPGSGDKVAHNPLAPHTAGRVSPHLTSRHADPRASVASLIPLVWRSIGGALTDRARRRLFMGPCAQLGRAASAAFAAGHSPGPSRAYFRHARSPRQSSGDQAAAQPRRRGGTNCPFRGQSGSGPRTASRTKHPRHRDCAWRRGRCDPAAAGGLPGGCGGGGDNRLTQRCWRPTRATGAASGVRATSAASGVRATGAARGVRICCAARSLGASARGHSPRRFGGRAASVAGCTPRGGGAAYDLWRCRHFPGVTVGVTVCRYNGRFNDGFDSSQV